VEKEKRTEVEWGMCGGFVGRGLKKRKGRKGGVFFSDLHK